MGIRDHFFRFRQRLYWFLQEDYLKILRRKLRPIVCFFGGHQPFLFKLTGEFRCKRCLRELNVLMSPTEYLEELIK